MTKNKKANQAKLQPHMRATPTVPVPEILKQKHKKTPEPSFSEPPFQLCGYCEQLQLVVDAVRESLKNPDVAKQENFYLVLEQLRRYIEKIGDCCYYASHDSYDDEDESDSTTGHFDENAVGGNNHNNNNTGAFGKEQILPKQ